MSDTQYQGQQVVYFLDFRIPGADSERIPVVDKITVGSDDDVEVSVDDYGLAPRHGIFRVHNDVLSIHNLGGSDNAKIGKQSLEHGKMYIIDAGDKISLGELEFIVRTEKVADAREYRKAIGVIDEEMDVADIISKSQEETGVHELDQNQNFFKKFINKIKGLFKKGSSEDSNETEEKKEEKKSDEEDTQSTGQKLLSELAKKKGKTQSNKLNLGAAKKKKKGFNIGSFSSLKGATTVHRILALVLNLLIFQTVYVIYVPQYELMPHFKKAAGEVIKLLEMGLAQLLPHIPKDYAPYLDHLKNEKYVIMVLIYLALEIAACLIFSVNLGQFLIRITSDGSFLGKRVKGVFRSILGIITTPFLIFDLPALAGNRTLKERLTLSTIGFSDEKAKDAGVIIFFPIFLVVVLISPFFNEPDFNQLPKSSVEMANIEKSKKAKFQAPSALLSSTIRAKKFSKMVFIPEMRFVEKKSWFGLHLVGTKKINSASMMMTKFDKKHLDLASLGLTGNIAGSLFYPGLTSAKTSELDEASIKELEQLMANAFRLTIDEAVNLLLGNGPFFMGLYKLREYVFKDYQVPRPTDIVFVDKPGQTLTVLKNDKEQFIPYFANSQYPLLVKIDHDGKSIALSEKLSSMFLKSSEPTVKSKKKKVSLKDKLTKRLEWSGVDVLDFYAYLDGIPQSVSPVLVNRYIQYMKSIGKISLTLGEKKLINKHIKILKETEKSLTKLRVPNVETVKKELKAQMNALKMRNLRYFSK